MSQPNVLCHLLRYTLLINVTLLTITTAKIPAGPADTFVLLICSVVNKLRHLRVTDKRDSDGSSEV